MPLPVLVRPPAPPIAPLRLRARPESTETRPALAPSVMALSTVPALVTDSVPSFSCTVPLPRLASPAIATVPPLNTCNPQPCPLLVPESVKVPPPSSARVPEPVTVPEKVLLVPLMPTVSAEVPRATVPTPDKASMVSLAETVRVAPDATVTDVLSSSAPPTRLSVNPPADTLVAPV
ncbi:hypothetical protein D9M70_197550 [compost metagenome]